MLEFRRGDNLLRQGAGEDLQADVLVSHRIGGKGARGPRCSLSNLLRHKNLRITLALGRGKGALGFGVTAGNGIINEVLQGISGPGQPPVVSRGGGNGERQWVAGTHNASVDSDATYCVSSPSWPQNQGIFLHDSLRRF